MRIPSVKTLAQVFDNPKQARKILEMNYAQLREHLSNYELYSDGVMLQLRMAALNAIDDRYYGVEYIHTYAGNVAAYYLNTGDTYAPTLMYCTGIYGTGWRVQSMGDYVDTAERNGVKFA